MISYVWGVSSGLQTAVTVRESKDGKRLFCIPSDLAIKNEESVKILESELFDKNKEKKYPDELLISIVYLYALENIFPCQ